MSSSKISFYHFLKKLAEYGTFFEKEFCRISLTVMCMMNLMKYPLDKQRCHIRILSCKIHMYFPIDCPSAILASQNYCCFTDAYDEEQLSLKWHPSLPITRNHNIKLPDMHLNNITTGLCDGTYAIGREGHIQQIICP